MVRIFLVEDNAIVRSQLRTALEKPENWRVVGEAENGRHAIETWDQHTPNVTVVDFMMPAMNGLDASRRLSQKHPDAPILMVTIDPSRQLAEEAKKAGIRGLCCKTDVRCIRSAIEVLLRGGTYFEHHMAVA